MDGIQERLILLSFLLEVVVLFYIEVKAWKSIYTPLVFLMLPYTIVLLISIAISGNWGFVEFYYPSILLWSVGLFVFAIPSFYFAFLLRKNNIPLNTSIKETSMPLLVSVVALFIILLFLYRFKSMAGGLSAIGTHDFGNDFSGRGFWGHLRQLSLPILIMAIYFVDKKNKWLWLIVIPLILVALLYQVLGWVIIPILVGISMRLYSGKTKLKASLLLYIVLFAAVVFFASYIMSLVVAEEDGELNEEVLAFICRNFIHYLTSGTLGLSVDMERGFPDAGPFELLIAQFINIGKMFIGDDEMVSVINPLFFNTGFNMTNVRTIFGTIYLNSNSFIFVIFTFLLSCSIYMLKLAAIRFKNVFIYTAYFFECGLLFMGWFDTYFSSLSSLEVPLMSLFLLLLCRVSGPKLSEDVISKNATEKI